MSGSNLTRVEAEARKAIVEAPIHYHVDLDLTVGPKNFGSKALICFNAKPGSSTFLDLIADENMHSLGPLSRLRRQFPSKRGAKTHKTQKPRLFARNSRGW